MLNSFEVVLLQYILMYFSIIDDKQNFRVKVTKESLNNILTFLTKFPVNTSSISISALNSVSKFSLIILPCCIGCELPSS